MNRPHHDDYLNSQMHEYQPDGPAPAHRLPFDRILPSLASAGELGEYMPQEDLAGTADAISGEAPGSDPAADGDDEDANVAHPDDVEVQLAVADERHMYAVHVDDVEVHHGGADEGSVYVEASGTVAVGDEEVDESAITAEHAIPTPVDASAQAEHDRAQENEPHTSDGHDAAAPEMYAHDAPGEESTAHASADAGTTVHESSAHDVDAHAESLGTEPIHAAMGGAETETVATHGGETGKAETQVAGTHEVHAHDGQAQDAAADSHMDLGHMHEEHMHEGQSHEEHAHDQAVQFEHQESAGAQAEQHEGESVYAEASEEMHAGHAVAEEEESAPVAAAHDDATGAAETHGGNGAPTTQRALSMAQPPAHATAEHASSAMEARGMLEGVAQSLRTLAGRDASGEGIAIFPRGVDVLEVRMHISRERDIDLNFRVAGPTVPSPSI